MQPAELIVGALIIGLVVWTAVALMGGVTLTAPKRGRMLCPICSEGLKGTEMVTVNGTVYHEKCHRRRKGRS